MFCGAKSANTAATAEAPSQIVAILVPRICRLGDILQDHTTPDECTRLLVVQEHFFHRHFMSVATSGSLRGSK